MLTPQSSAGLESGKSLISANLIADLVSADLTDADLRVLTSPVVPSLALSEALYTINSER
jgi:hypothetical protein